MGMEEMEKDRERENKQENLKEHHTLILSPFNQN